MVRAKTRKKPVAQTQEILSVSEKEALLDQKRELEDTLREAENFGQGTAAEQLDKNNLKRQIARIDDEIEARSVSDPRGKTKDNLHKEVDELAEKLKEGLPTRYEMDHPAKCPGAVRKHMGWLDRNDEHIKRWRYIQRVLNPDSPRSIEELRESGKPRD
ncbi:MAG: hypothetical protein ACW987_08950 [Candidatus Thorarchaeota archaeon]|jgi:hypothetical protein